MRSHPSCTVFSFSFWPVELTSGPYHPLAWNPVLPQMGLTLGPQITSPLVEGPYLVLACGVDLGFTPSTGLEPCCTTTGVDLRSTDNVSMVEGSYLLWPVELTLGPHHPLAWNLYLQPMELTSGPQITSPLVEGPYSFRPVELTSGPHSFPLACTEF